MSEKNKPEEQDDLFGEGQESSEEQNEATPPTEGNDLFSEEVTDVSYEEEENQEEAEGLVEENIPEPNEVESATVLSEEEDPFVFYQPVAEGQELAKPLKRAKFTQTRKAKYFYDTKEKEELGLELAGMNIKRHELEEAKKIVGIGLQGTDRRNLYRDRQPVKKHLKRI